VSNMYFIYLGANWTSDRCYAKKGWVCQEPALVLTEPTTTVLSTIPTTTEKRMLT